MTDQQRVRIGVLGCGQIAQAAHLPSVTRARNADLYAICDVSDELRERMATVFRPATTFADYDAMLADPLVDAVIVAIADQFHVPMAIRALEAGKHVLVEKPMAVTVEEAERLRDAVERTGRILHVGTNKRYDSGIAFARDFIHEELGEIIAMKAWYCDSVYRYTLTDNLQPVIEQGVGVLRPPGDPKADRQRYLMLGHGSHLVDTARYLAGEIDRVRATVTHRGGAWAWSIEAAFSSGAMGHLDLIIPVALPWHEGFEVHGEGGSVTGTVFNPWELRSAQVDCWSNRDAMMHRPAAADGHSYRLQVEGFADDILGLGDPYGARVEDGLAAVRTMVAIAQSAASGEWVRPRDASGGV